MTAKQINCLKEALDAASLKRCGVNKEAQEKMKLYLDSWVVDRIKLVLEAEEGDKEAKYILNKYYK